MRIIHYSNHMAGTHTKSRSLIWICIDCNTIMNVYDSMGRIREQDDCGTKIYYTHTGTGKLKSITDACGNEIITERCVHIRHGIPTE